MKQTDQPRRALGKGLSALLPSKTARPVPSPADVQGKPQNGVLTLSIEEIEPNPLQPRSAFEPERLAELAQSIRSNGIIQPLVVVRKDNRYQLVAGERRWRAAKLAGLSKVPVVIQDIADDHLLEITLIENIQREDLNAIEIAHAFDRLARELKLSHEEIGRRTGKDRTTITNMLRLLRLPEDVQRLVAEHRLSMGHARAILALPSPDLQTAFAEKASAQGLSVRQVERMVQRATETREPREPDEERPDPNVKAALAELEQKLGTRVRIIEKALHRGRIEIDYFSQEDLQRIYSLIVGEEN